MAEGLFTLDCQGRFMYLNDAALKMLGWTSQELYGKRMHDMIHL
jgi:PAS domain S-box-containing protein